MSAASERSVLDLRLLLPALLAWAVCAALLSAPTGLVLAVGVGTLAAAVVSASRRSWAWVLCCVAMTVLLVGLLGHRSVADSGLVPSLAQRSATVRVEAKVISDPVRLPPKATAEPMWRVRLQITRISGRGEVSSARTPVLAFGGEALSTLRWHERVRAVGRLQPPRDGADVRATLRISGPVEVTSRAGPIEQAVEHLRGGLRSSTAGLPQDPAGLVPALVIGDTSRLPEQLNEDMRATGMTHLNAVSGSNVTVVLLCVQWLAGLIRVPRRWRMPFAFVGLGLFVMLCRPEPSVVRASAMGVVGLLAFRTGSRPAGAPALAAAILVLLIIDPGLSRSFGFILSSLATLGLLLFARRWADVMAARLPRRCKPLAEATAVPLAAQVFCAPVTVLLQPMVSLVGLPANVLAAPLVPIATVAGVLVVVTAPILAPVAMLLAWVAGLPAWGIALIAHAAAAVPFGALPWIGGWWGVALLVAVISILLVTGPWWWAQALRRRWAAAAAALTALAVTAPVPPGPVTGGWVAAMCDVGQGDAMVLRGSVGHTVLIDTGPDPEAVGTCLDRLGVAQLDAVVLTHFHADHVAGLAGALRGRVVREVFITSVDQDEGASRSDEASARGPTLELLARRRIPVHSLRQGDQLSWPGLTAGVLWPARILTEGSVQNNGSLVLDVDLRGQRMLLTGDIEREAAANVRRALAGSPDRRPIALLKVAHHGSSNQDDALVLAAGTQVCLISVGRDNSYGHPAPRTLQLLARSGCAVLRTDQRGTVVLHLRAGVLATSR
ncbi:DNA internalization-related competence protein ComEC/Rec2 [Yimella sp. cx-51]|uniref:DNA internalization-related competence protein ComEC/Rec2 n=1 Tax=Yimella sp. cx-51 TaxID=2770551 RepID=UPI00165E3137|nr:DNA internalization-related competence protein ComEC/Rec2 [Yimella sp. cx-51]MBC9957234.1 DNA internalization-related competence protein ComEC/Rec2 [Yimella sp. cx-51]QTH37122.1 DNA internalization-related competence protein ComEC/Rec2 [Yimella sp. cx-51]